MTLEQWLEWQANLHSHAIDLGLDRVAKVWKRLGRRLNVPVITIAGTNGKGSGVAMLEAIYQAAGYQVGSYTSPHLFAYNERIKINQQPVSDEEIVGAFEAIEQSRGEVPLTYFEYGTLAALVVFASRSLNVVILEVGLGGRLDAVNIIDADVSLITSIGLDHQDWLGDSIEEIAREKAGILRSGHASVYGSSNMPASIGDVATNLGSTLYRLGEEFRIERQENAWSFHSGDIVRSGLPFPRLRGEHQLNNAASVLMVLQLLNGELPVDQRAIREGLLSAKNPGRFEVVAENNVTWIYDVAHNPHAVEMLKQNIEGFPANGKRYALLAMLKDKDAEGVYEIIRPEIDCWVIAGLDVDRGLSVDQWEKMSWLEPESRNFFGSVPNAIDWLESRLLPGDLVLVLGSFYTVSQAKLKNRHD